MKIFTNKQKTNKKITYLFIVRFRLFSFCLFCVIHVDHSLNHAKGRWIFFFLCLCNHSHTKKAKLWYCTSMERAIDISMKVQWHGTSLMKKTEWSWHGSKPSRSSDFVILRFWCFLTSFKSIPPSSNRPSLPYLITGSKILIGLEHRCVWTLAISSCWEWRF